MINTTFYILVGGIFCLLFVLGWIYIVGSATELQFHNLVLPKRQKTLNNATETSSFDPNYPGANFVTLRNRTDLGLYYTKNANVVASEMKYAVISSNRLTKNTHVDYWTF